MLPQTPVPRQLFTDPNTPVRRRRAESLRRRALSPVRILIMVLLLPVTTAAIALSVYLRTSKFEQEDAIFHLIALGGCSASEAILPGPYFIGEPGYHRRNDPDGDGAACGNTSQTAASTTNEPPKAATVHAVGTAKFVRP